MNDTGYCILCEEAGRKLKEALDCPELVLSQMLQDAKDKLEAAERENDKWYDNFWKVHEQFVDAEKQLQDIGKLPDKWRNEAKDFLGTYESFHADELEAKLKSNDDG